MRKSLARWFVLAGLLTAGFTSCGARGPAFSVVVLGCEGGLAEGNLSCYLLTRPGSGSYVALDAGTVLGGLRQAVARGSLNDCKPGRESDQSHEGWVLREGIKAYLVSHAHIDHVSGLVIDSTDDISKPLLGLNPTIDDLRDHLFNWKTWPNFGSEGDRPLNQYRYQRLSEGESRQIDSTDLQVQAFTLSHSNHYPSSAFLIRSGEQYLLYCGDTGPDEVEKSEGLQRVWAASAPLIREGKLRGIMLECSYPDGREPGQLFGHLTPEWMMKELHILAAAVDASQPQRALAGLKVAVTHIKPSLQKGKPPRQLVEEQLRQRNDLEVQFVFPNKVKGWTSKMGWKASRRDIQMRLLYRQNRWLLQLLLGWLLFSFGVLVLTGHAVTDSLAILFFLEEDKSHFGYFYASMTDFVIFGLVISVILVDMQRQVRPEATCRVMAEELHRHAIIFHFSNLGRRTWQLFVDNDIPVTVVDPDQANLEELIRDGYPCLVGTGRTAADLDAVNVADARFVMICSDHLESAAVICSLVRQRNPKCDLVARCADDDIGEVLARRYQATVVSTSLVASQFLREYLTKNKVEKCVLIGGGQLGRRMIPIVEEMEHEFSMVAAHEADVADLLDKSHYIIGRYTDDRVLEQAGVVDTDLVLFTEDDFSLAMATVDRVRGLNHRCRIICRVFMDDAADLLHSDPFNCDIFSTSRQAVEQLRQQGAFKVLGLPGSSKGATLVAGSEIRAVKAHPHHEQKPHIKQKIGSR